jgi:ribosomal protein S27E
VKVWVPEGDVNAAVEVLDQPATTVDDRPILTCPECGSHDVTPDRTGLRRTMLSWLLLGVPIFRVRRGQLRCDRCGHIFATPDGPNAA